MTKNEYSVVASAIYGSLITTVNSEQEKLYFEQYKRTAEDIADAFAQDNPYFNRDAFIEDCGVASLQKFVFRNKNKDETP